MKNQSKPKKHQGVMKENLSSVNDENVPVNKNSSHSVKNDEARTYLFQKYEEMELGMLNLHERIEKSLDRLELQKMIKLISDQHSKLGKT